MFEISVTLTPYVCVNRDIYPECITETETGNELAKMKWKRDFKGSALSLIHKEKYPFKGLYHCVMEVSFNGKYFDNDEIDIVVGKNNVSVILGC